ncbi:2-oxoglutarate dehydrogenase E1 component [Verrucomicrobiota bacterium sgz303538]
MATSFATRFNADLLEQNYERWRKDPASVDSTWAAFFEGFELGTVQPGKNGHAAGTQKATGVAEDVSLQTRVDGLVYAYRTLGHTIAQLDPLSNVRPENPLLSLRELGFEEKDLDLTVSSKFYLGGRSMKLREMIASLEATYCSTIGFEFMHIQNPRVRNWVRDRIESRVAEYKLSVETQRRMLQQMLAVESFERFLHTKYVGQKRFSMEGGESMIVALYALLENSPQNRVNELVMGMAHRGRLSVLVEFVQKSMKVMFAKFSENFIPNTVGGDGDVKYHLGYRTTRKVLDTDHEVEIRLAANPSHLEAVDPVVLGTARARQRVRKDTEERGSVVPVLIHGDAALAGQGVVAETLNMSQLQGYRVGGTVHIVINNQIGFTTLPTDARSSRYCTDVAKMIEAPVFHVNGDDPDAVRYCAELALDFRQQFKRDVFVDIVCYRRHGHNEGDEPAFTQPTMYADIATHLTPGRVYMQRLLDRGVLTQEDAAGYEKEFVDRYEAALAEVKKAEEAKDMGRFDESTAVFQPEYSHAPVDTSISKDVLDQVCRALVTTPEGFNVVPKLKRGFLEKRLQAWKNGGPFDWAHAEAIAFGSLLVEGTPIRLSGQDSRRGTFTQRHSYLYDEKTRDRYCPLKNVDPHQAMLCIYNSPLSEEAVLGFDYGYSLNYPEMLCMWEGQFGDFVNGAQNIIDQFIVSSESKWHRTSGIVLLLPHGYEGQGPEHSSARLERFLQSCAEDNIQVCNATTPAQYFHLLRRQMRRNFVKPLVLMTPKSLLRHPECVSHSEDFLHGHFNEILDDTEFANAPDKAKRVIFCTGKVYYDLIAFRRDNQIANTAIVRIEQLYPLNEDALAAIIARYSGAKNHVWCQEEPQNMGAWSYIAWPLRRLVNKAVLYAGREASASPAVGALSVHKIEQKQLVEQAFTVNAAPDSLLDRLLR